MRAEIMVGVVLLMLATATAEARGRGVGTGHASAATAPVTKDGGAEGSDVRAGAHPVTTREPRTAAPDVGEAYAEWKSGDRVRSASSADVRSTRQQAAPDLEWAGAAPGPTQLQPQAPYGKKVQQAQQPPRR